MKKQVSKNEKYTIRLKDKANKAQDKHTCKITGKKMHVKRLIDWQAM